VIRQIGTYLPNTNIPPHTAEPVHGSALRGDVIRRIGTSPPNANIRPTFGGTRPWFRPTRKCDLSNGTYPTFGGSRPWFRPTRRCDPPNGDIPPTFSGSRPWFRPTRRCDPPSGDIPPTFGGTRPLFWIVGRIQGCDPPNRDIFAEYEHAPNIRRNPSMVPPYAERRSAERGHTTNILRRLFSFTYRPVRFHPSSPIQSINPSF